MQGGGLGTLHKNLLQVNQEEILVLQTLSTRRFPLQCWVLPGVTVFLLGSSRCRHSPAAVWAEQRAVISTGGSGEMGGTVHSVEMKRSLVRSGTGKTPERCFGNSGENWSARKNREGGYWLQRGVHSGRQSRTELSATFGLRLLPSSTAVDMFCSSGIAACLGYCDHPGWHWTWLGSGEGELYW